MLSTQTYTMSSQLLDLLDNMKQFNPSMEDLGHGVLDEYCGCMISKWDCIEFKKIFAIDRDYLQVAVIYIEPFTDFDYLIMCFDWDKVPANIMKIYMHAKTHTIFKETDGMVEMLAPYINKPCKTIIKRFPSTVSIFGDMHLIEGSYITMSKDLKKINNIFRLV